MGKKQASAGKGSGGKQVKSGASQDRSDGRTQKGTFQKGQSGNPGGRSKISETVDRLDGWAGRRNGMGVRGIDKGVDMEFCVERVTDAEAAELWAGDDIVKRVIEFPADEMYREGFELKTDDVDQTQLIVDALSSLKVVDALRLAKKYERAYGGAAIFPVLNDGERDLRKPLNMSRIREVSALHVLEPAELDVVSYYGDIMLPKYRLPEIYRLNPIAPDGSGGGKLGQTEIHESRLVIWRGIHVTHRVNAGARPGWGDNVVTQMKAALRGFNLSFTAISTLIADFAQAVIKMKNLAAMLAQGKVTEVQARMRMVEISRSIARAVLVDTEETYERQTTNVSGLSDLADRVMSRLAAAANMPVTFMMGQSPKGLGNEGDSDQAWMDKQTGGMQESDEPKVKQVVDVVLAAKDGPTKGEKPETLSLTWLPLDSPSEAETATARFTQAQTDEKYVTMGVLSPDDVALSRFGGEAYSFETTIDWDAREAAQLEMEQAEQEREAQAQAIAAAQAAGAPPTNGGSAMPTGIPGAEVPAEGDPAADPAATPTTDERPGRSVTIKGRTRIIRSRS